MWRNFIKLNNSTLKPPLGLLPSEIPLIQSLRSTFILKRRNTPFTHKKNAAPKKLRTRHYIYDFVKDVETDPTPKIDVILTSFVEGLGNAGDKVNVRAPFAYDQLLLPGLAVYASPENLEKYKEYERQEDAIQYSSKNAIYIMQFLTNLDVAFVMNRETPWSIKPWHVRMQFRKAGFEVPLESISIPHEINGPNLELENKDFYVTITINKKEKVNVRCILHHWSTVITDRIPYRLKFWEEFSGTIFPEDKPIIDEIIAKRTKKKEKKAK